MDVDGLPNQSMSIATASEDMNQLQVMDEELESFDQGGFDILELESACKKEFDKIPEHQLSTLEVIIAKGIPATTTRHSTGQLLGRWSHTKRLQEKREKN